MYMYTGCVPLFSSHHIVTTWIFTFLGSGDPNFYFAMTGKEMEGGQPILNMFRAKKGN